MSWLLDWLNAWTTDTQWRHRSKKSENLGRCGRQNMLLPYLKILEWEWIFGHPVKAVSSLGVRSPWLNGLHKVLRRVIGTLLWKMNLTLKKSCLKIQLYCMWYYLLREQGRLTISNILIYIHCLLKQNI